MRNDDAVKGFSEAVNGIVPLIYKKIRLFSVWDIIDELDNAELDELAWELDIQWYDASVDIEIKREVIRMSDLVYSRLGTKWAVEWMVQTYFGSGEVREWYEYGGEPHHFKIISGNPSLTNERINQFIQMLKIVKRKSSWLDAILIALTGEMNLYVGVAYHDTNIETHAIYPRQSNVLSGETNVYLRLIPHEISMERHTLYGAEYSQINKEGIDII